MEGSLSELSLNMNISNTDIPNRKLLYPAQYFFTLTAIQGLQ